MKHFPQISRTITAKVSKIALLAVLTALLATQLYPTNSLTQAQTAVLLSPRNVSSHLLLSQKYLASGNMPAVERELTLTQSLNTPYDLHPTASVLGITLSPLKILENIKAEPQQIRNEIAFWEKVVAEKSGYRDAYLQLTILNYKIYQIDRAKKYLEKAKEIDPNYEKVQELENLFKN